MSTELCNFLPSSRRLSGPETPKNEGVSTRKDRSAQQRTGARAHLFRVIRALGQVPRGCPGLRTSCRDPMRLVYGIQAATFCSVHICSKDRRCGTLVITKSSFRLLRTARLSAFTPTTLLHPVQYPHSRVKSFQRSAVPTWHPASALKV